MDYRKQMLEYAEKYASNVAVWRITGTGVSGLILESHLDSSDIASLNTLIEESGYKVEIGGYIDEQYHEKPVVEIEVRIYRG